MGLLGLGCQFTLRCDRFVAVDAQRIKVLLAELILAPLQDWIFALIPAHLVGHNLVHM